MDDNKIDIYEDDSISFYVNQVKYNIPSDMFPLNNRPIILCNINTHSLNTKKIKDIFNNTEYLLGRCYTNSDVLYNKLLKAKINPNHLKYLVGWLFIDKGFPIHHALLLYQNKYVLDLSPIMLGTDYYVKFLSEHKLWKNENDWRNSYLKWYKKFNKQSHSITGTFGQMKDVCFFVGSESSKDEGIRIWNNLMNKYPQHPSDNNSDKNGLTPIQKEILR